MFCNNEIYSIKQQKGLSKHEKINGDTSIINASS